MYDAPTSGGLPGSAGSDALDMAPDGTPLFHSVITDDSTSVVGASTSSGSLPHLGGPERYVSIKCNKCRSVNCSSRRFCSNCGQKLRAIVETDKSFESNRRMTNLPPLPVNMPPKVSIRAFRLFILVLTIFFRATKLRIVLGRTWCDAIGMQVSTLAVLRARLCPWAKTLACL